MNQSKLVEPVTDFKGGKTRFIIEVTIDFIFLFDSLQK